MLGRLPWFAPLFLRSRRLRARLGHGLLLPRVRSISTEEPSPDGVGSSDVNGCPEFRTWCDGDRQGKGGTAVSTLSELLAEHTRMSRRRRRAPAAGRRRVAAAGRHVLRRLPAVGAAPMPRVHAARRDHSVTELTAAVPAASPRPVRPPRRPRTRRTSSAARVTASQNPQLRRAVAERRICREEDPRWHLEVPVRRETIPVRHGSAVLAVLSRDTNLAMPRVPSPLEIAYLGSAVGPLPDDRRRHVPAARVRRRGGQPARGPATG